MGKLKNGYYSLLIALLIIPICSQAQCLSGNCYAFASASTLQICEGQSVTLTGEGGSAALNNNFNTQTLGQGWLTNNNVVNFNNPCGAGVDGTPYLWFGANAGAGTRLIQTVDFNMSGGGTIAFDLKFALQSQGSPCEGPDEVDEGVSLQYSTNYGSTWVDIIYFSPNGQLLPANPNPGGSTVVNAGVATNFTTWNNYIFNIPPGAQTLCTRFRWFQPYNTTATNDHWGIDNVLIAGPPPTPGNITFKWTDGPGAAAPRIVTPADDTQYILMYGNSTDTCYDTLNVVVHDVPDAAMFASPVQACLGSPIQFDASASDAGTTPIADYKWIFNNSWVINQTTTAPTTSFTFPITGTFNTSVIVTAGICRDTAIVPVTVSVPPSVAFTYPSQVCEGTPVVLDASTTTIPNPGVINTYAWDFANDGTIDITENQPTTATVFSNIGSIPVKLIVTSAAGCAASLIHNVSVLDIPEADFTYNDACIGATTNFQNQTVGTTTQWNWDLDGLSASTLQSPSYIFSGAGTYMVKLIANNGNACYDTAEATLEIKNTVQANFSFNEPCTLMGIFADSSSIPITSGGTLNSWNWNFGNGYTSSDQNPTYPYNANGVYNVRLIVGTDLGCLDTVSYSVPKYAIPHADFSVENVCYGQITNFSNTSAVESGIIESAYWSYGDGQYSDTYSPSYSFDAYGSFPVTLWVETENGCRDSIMLNYQVYPQPVADFEATPEFTNMLSPDVQFTDLSQYAESWVWTFGTSGGSTDQNPLYTFTSSGSYDVVLVVSNQYGCKASVVHPYEVMPAYNFYIPASFTPFNGDGLNEYFRIYHTGVKEMNFMIYNSWGEELLFTNDPNFMWDGKLKGKQLPQGTYVYKAWVRNVEGAQYQYSGHIFMIY